MALFKFLRYQKVLLSSLVLLTQLSLADVKCNSLNFVLPTDAISVNNEVDPKLNAQLFQHTNKVRQIISQMFEPAQLERGASSLHKAWQKSNPYQTRYKEITDENGNYFYNREDYFTKYNIPIYYQKYFRINQFTHYLEEDIKKIPHEYLSPINKFKNLQGSRDMATEISKLLLAAPKTEEEAHQQVWQAQQNFHSSWYKLNISWAKNSRPELLENETVFNKITNLSALFTYFSEQMDPKDKFNSLTLKVLKSRYHALWMDLLKPYEGLPIAQAYLALLQAKGHKMSLNPELNDFFNAKITHRLQSEGPLPKITESNSERGKYFKTLLLAEIQAALNLTGDFYLAIPETPPGSGAQVYLIRDTGDDRVLGALKVQDRDADENNKYTGLDELLTSLSVEAFLKLNRPEVGIVEIKDFGILNELTYFTIISPAKNRDLDGWLKSKPKKELQNLILEAVAETTAHLHFTGSQGDSLENHGPSKNSRTILETFKSNSLYEVFWFRDFIENQKLEIRARTIGYPEVKVNVIKEKIIAATSEYEKELDTKLSQFHYTINHGDFHGGNIFYDKSTNRSTLIDYGAVTWTIAADSRSGTGDPGNDLGRLMGNILLEDIKQGNYSLDSYDKLKVFYLYYLKTSATELNSSDELILRKSVLFYINRYFAIQCADMAGVKFKSEIPNDKLLTILFEAWLDLKSDLWIK